ncbi:unnamed protein product [Cladocopium goreaui]|uniref:peptidylprolyl isomerase n=1 Tax=Cladocopium goreaui TaxID=2562237 RepID=A0A9P1GDU7_9DINO|nr:unnamed protein product [Cladocopium goreaui]
MAKRRISGNLRESPGSEAEQSYRKALSCIWALYRQRSVGKAVELGQAVDLNLALCYLKLERYDSARRCASRVLEVDSENSKALYRRALALRSLERTEEAERDLMMAWQVSKSPEVRRELLALRKLRGEESLPLGFLQPEAETEADWAVTEQVQDALQEASGFLQAIAERKIACRSAGEVSALCAQVDAMAQLLPEVKRVIQEAKLVPPPEGAQQMPLEVKVVEVVDLLEKLGVGVLGHHGLQFHEGKMCSGLESSSFRPFFKAQERRDDEFRSLRVCRSFGSATSFDVELVRWGDAQEATPENFAAALFGASGKPRNAAEAQWQRELFYRIFLTDASRYVAGAAWLLLRAGMAGPLRLQHEGRDVLELGLARGMFFAPPQAEGPAENGAAEAASADALAICSGEDRRLVVLPSFGSLGIMHHWLLLKVSGGETLAIDLCPGAVAPSRVRLRVWQHESDSRYILRSAHFSDAADTAVVSGSESRQMREALRRLAEGSGMNLSQGQLDAMFASQKAPHSIESSDDRCLAALHACARRQGLQLVSADLEAAHEAAVKQLVLRKLQRYGFEKAAREFGAEKHAV